MPLCAKTSPLFAHTETSSSEESCSSVSFYMAGWRSGTKKVATVHIITARSLCFLFFFCLFVFLSFPPVSTCESLTFYNHMDAVIMCCDWDSDNKLRSLLQIISHNHQQQIADTVWLSQVRRAAVFQGKCTEVSLWRADRRGDLFQYKFPDMVSIFLALGITIHFSFLKILFWPYIFSRRVVLILWNCSIPDI